MKIDSYNFELYFELGFELCRFKVCAFFETQCRWTARCLTRHAALSDD